MKFPTIFLLIEDSVSLLLRIIRFLVPKNHGTENIVIISLHKMGDTILTIPALKKLIDHYQKNLILFTYSESLPLYKLVFPEIRAVTVDQQTFIFSGRLARRKHRKILGSINPRIIIDLTGSIRAASLIFNSRASGIIGINERQYRNLYNTYIPVSFRSHLSEIYMNVVEALNIDTSIEPLFVNTKKNNLRDNSVLIFPLAGWNSKEWGINNFISLARSIMKKAPASFVIPEGSLQQDILVEIRRIGLSVIETKSVEEMIEVISRHSTIICNDSGPSHVGELLGKRTITVFGPTNPAVHKESSENSINIMNLIKCSPGNAKMCFANGGRDCPSNECMKSLTVEKLLVVT